MTSLHRASMLPIALAVLAASAAAQTIDNLSNWPGSGGFGSFGTGGGTSSDNTYGQSFIAPAQSFLTSWAMAFQTSSLNSFNYRFYVAPWDAANVRLAGAPVFSSGTITSPANGAGFVQVTVPVNVLLTPGVAYMAFTSTAALPGQALATANQAGFTGSDTYTNGGFYKNAASSLANLSVDRWDDRFNSYDTAFRASFTPIPTPEPATIAAFGLGALTLLRRRRRQA